MANVKSTTITEAHSIIIPPTQLAKASEGVGRVRPMSESTYLDSWGRMFAVYVEEGRDPSTGIIKGPMPLDTLGLPQEVMVRLHNELYIRGLFTLSDVQRRPNDVLGAIQAAYGVDVQTIQALYAGGSITSVDRLPAAAPAPATIVTPNSDIQELRTKEQEKEDASTSKE